ncbi:hypothetical protein BC828DRAFT_405366 [Blastocladiella britannica]|nr:hypothetical protein BC828DRAFT_405366 [Blastocladiella britannica]
MESSPSANALDMDPRKLLRRLRLTSAASVGQPPILTAWELLAAAALAAGAVSVAVVAARAARSLYAKSAIPESLRAALLTFNRPASDDNDSYLPPPPPPAAMLPGILAEALARTMGRAAPGCRGSFSSSSRRVRISISIRNTALWSPSSDPTMPNYAFAEGAKLALVRGLAANPLVDLYIIAAASSAAERAEVARLLGAAGVYAYVPPERVMLVDPSTTLPSANDPVGLPMHLVAQLHAVRTIAPDLHIEGSRSSRLLGAVAAIAGAVVWVHPRLASARVAASLTPDSSSTTETRADRSREDSALAFSETDAFVPPASMGTTRQRARTMSSSTSTLPHDRVVGTASSTALAPGIVATPSMLMFPTGRADPLMSPSPSMPPTDTMDLSVDDLTSMMSLASQAGSLADRSPEAAPALRPPPAGGRALQQQQLLQQQQQQQQQQVSSSLRARASLSSSSTASTATTTAAAGAPILSTVVPPNVVVAARLAHWCDQATELGQLVAEAGLLA